jgi:hypothetical protein
MEANDGLHMQVALDRGKSVVAILSEAVSVPEPVWTM